MAINGSVIPQGKVELPLAIIQSIPTGRYAWATDPTKALTFVWIKDYESGKRKGQRRVRVQHGPWYTEGLTVFADGKMTKYDRDIEEILTGIFCNKFQAARAYGQQIGNCSRCNLELTDRRSRHYGIGPECEKVWPWFIEEVDNEMEGTYEELLAAGKLEVE